MKYLKRIWVLLLVTLLFTSCSFTELMSPRGLDLNQSEGLPGQAADITDDPGREGELVYDDTHPSQVQIDLTIVGEDLKEDSEDAVPVGAVIQITGQEGQDADSGVNAVESDINEMGKEVKEEFIQMEIQLYFADRDLVIEGKAGPYGFVTPVTRKVPATSGILKVTFNELIKGPKAGETDLDPVMPASALVNKITILDRVAVIDFNKALLTDNPGGTLGGSITMQAIVFTVAQFESVDGAMVTVEGKPWDDGHFIWDMPIYKKDLLHFLEYKNGD